jgi:UDP:flavonoid glycosyltransferase YjiC (YdhE family)
VVGTRGDAQPIVALGRTLRARGCSVTVATSHDHRPLVEAHGLEWSDLSPSYADEIEQAEERLGGSQADGARLLRERLTAASANWAEQARTAASGADLIVGAGTLMGAVASSAAETLSVPCAHVHVMPLTPTRAFPPPIPPPSWRLPGPVNLALFRTIRLLVWRACFARPLAVARRDLALPPLPWAGPAPAAPTLCTWSPHLLPQPPDWPASHIRVTGPWLLPDDDAPDPELRHFVETGDPPVFIGFGSMRLAAAPRARLTNAITDFLRRSGRRAIIGTAWGALDARALEPSARVLVVRTAPFEWLFPRMSLIIHHGGAGTTMAAARAGVPQLVLPFVLDQFFWAWQLVRLGVSPTRLSRRSLTGATLTGAAERATDPAIRDKAARLAERLSGEDGIATAIDTLIEWGLLRTPEPALLPCASNETGAGR